RQGRGRITGDRSVFVKGSRKNERRKSGERPVEQREPGRDSAEPHVIKFRTFRSQSEAPAGYLRIGNSSNDLATTREPKLAKRIGDLLVSPNGRAPIVSPKVSTHCQGVSGNYGFERNQFWRNQLPG